MSEATNIIFGCSGLRLTQEEYALFKDTKPWGFILFARNIHDRQQVKALVEDFKEATDRENVVVLIDQEGGRVSRLPKPEWRIPPSPPFMAQLYKTDPALATKAFYLNYRLIGYDLKEIGVNVNCAPMLDIPVNGASSVVTDRALGTTAEQVSKLGAAVCSALKDSGVAPVIKHGPGHGRALVDSHHLLPHVDAPIETLEQVDFVPFKELNQETMLMTAHIIFGAIDPNLPGTTSPRVISDIIRGKIGFKGLIMSDDLNMHALEGSIGQRTKACLTAGCDIALQCSGELADMKDASRAISLLSGLALERSKAAEAQAFSNALDLDPADTAEELNGLLSDLPQ